MKQKNKAMHSGKTEEKLCKSNVHLYREQSLISEEEKIKIVCNKFQNVFLRQKKKSIQRGDEKAKMVLLNKKFKFKCF